MTARTILVSVFLFLPFLLLAMPSVINIQLFQNYIATEGVPTLFGRILMFIGIFLFLPAGLIFNALPLLKKGSNGKRNLPSVNLVFVVVFLIPIFVIAWGFTAEVYKCEILEIPNCD